jgi:hypothetical protein
MDLRSRAAAIPRIADLRGASAVGPGCAKSCPSVLGEQETCTALGIRPWEDSYEIRHLREVERMGATEIALKRGTVWVSVYRVFERS